MVTELMASDHSVTFYAQSHLRQLIDSSEVTVVMTSVMAEILADGYTKNFSHPSNSLFIPFILTLGAGKISPLRVVKVTASDKSKGYPTVTEIPMVDLCTG
ncbi:hypothetical protein [Xenorhabdus siamensis]|uniref:hypothetical protein n=1 Tax=Xenorhabdus siamensis TaxID=3136254 RepID=UPI0030F41D38